MALLTLCPYSSEHKKEWDDFVAASKNATFLHRRDYLEYHADRFPDRSLMVYRDNKLYALLPATFDGETFSSHAGLTYGGLLLNTKATTAEVLDVMQLILDYARRSGASRFIYKPVPHIYHRLPAEEDLYALFRMDATIIARNVSAVIDTAHPVKLRDIRKSGIRHALREGVSIEENEEFGPFWEVLNDNLMSKYATRAVHTLEEITHLKRLFPDNIRLYTAIKSGKVVAGVVIFVTHNVAHTQYISASPEGKACGALDLLFHHLTATLYADKRYFDFGTSNEDHGRYLNESLIYQKEGFGARAIVYDTYSIPLK